VTDQNGEPIWNLDEAKFSVNENQSNLDVNKVYQISNDKSIHVGLVLDESGSMEVDESQLFDRYGNPLYRVNIFGNITFPKGYVKPIDAMKRASSKFLDAFNFEKDSIALIAFSDQVNQVVVKGEGLGQVKRGIRSLEADGGTAFYTAVDRGLEEIKIGDGLKVLVALTDGNDNRSSLGLDDVVLKAQLYEIPIYVIGLGDVNQDTLALLARETNGEYYYSRNAFGLDDVYQRIKDRIQSVYGLTYQSQNFNPSDTSREVLIQYMTDSSYASANHSVELPDEVITYLEERRNKRVFYTAIGVGVAIGLGGYLLLYRRRSKVNVA
jgi:Ca-activated chloride channel family protein